MNPFAYIRTDKDILKFVTALIANTKKSDKAGGDDFWVQAETLLYTALISFIHYEAPDEERNLNTLVDMIGLMEVREEDETFKNAVDMAFDDLEQKNPQHIAVRQYRKYKLAAGMLHSERRIIQKYTHHNKQRRRNNHEQKVYSPIRTPFTR